MSKKAHSDDKPLLNHVRSEPPSEAVFLFLGQEDRCSAKLMEDHQPERVNMRSDVHTCEPQAKSIQWILSRWTAEPLTNPEYKVIQEK